MPHNSHVMLPKTWTKLSVYKKFKKGFHEERKVPNKDIISYPHFVSLWSQHLPKYVIRKVIRAAKSSTYIQVKPSSSAL